LRGLHLFLAVYFVLLAGAAIAMWQSGILARIPELWLAGGVLVAVGLGVGVALTSTRPT
jgi:hypothetical protein